MTVRLTPHPLTREEVVRVARAGEELEISEESLARVRRTREDIEAMVRSGTPVYGVSTGFGSLANTFVEPSKRTQLQRSLVRSHAAGLGDWVEDDVVRAMMVCRLTTLASGVAGVREETVRAYAALVNRSVTPGVHEFGSLGCSGDLAPLAHVALVLTGEGVARVNGEWLEGSRALAAAGLGPVTLAEKEGLALLNGTDGMLGHLILALEDFRVLLDTLDAAAALSIQALRGTDRVFTAELQALRPHPGQATSAARILALLADSPLVASHVNDTSQIQDAYSLRCAPQVHGAARDTWAHAARVADVELAATIDNPSVLEGGRLSSNGNFHGAPVAYVLDFLAVASADVASMSERRTDRLLDVHRNFGLPPFLADDPGVDSGLMIAQYTQAGLVSEMKRWATPASVDSIPSSAMQEDHVSMGWHAGRKLRRSLEALARVVAIELVAGTRAMMLRGVDGASPATRVVIDLVSDLGGGPGPDRFLAPELAAVASAVADGSIARAVNSVLGEGE